MFLIFHSIQPECSYVLYFFANSEKIVKYAFIFHKITPKIRPFKFGSGYWASIFNLKNKDRFEHENVLKQAKGLKCSAWKDFEL